jgi:hypothetical protein
METHTPAELANMLEVVKLNPPTPQLPVDGGLSALDQMILGYVFDHRRNDFLWRAHSTFSAMRLNLKRARAKGGDEVEAWGMVVSAADTLADELRRNEAL